MSNQVVDNSHEEFDITDAIERSFENWYGQQSTQAVGEWYTTPNCFIAINQSMSDEATTPQWSTMIFQRKQSLVKLILQLAEMTMVSPHILKIVIELKPQV